MVDAIVDTLFSSFLGGKSCDTTEEDLVVEEVSGNCGDNSSDSLVLMCVIVIYLW